MLDERAGVSDVARPGSHCFPGAMITLAVTSFNFLGDGLRDALDPRVDER